VWIDNTSEESQLIFENNFTGSLAAEPDLNEWHQLQQWLQETPHAVIIPYGRVLARAIPPVAPRLHRDTKALASLISAHAILHQVNRERDDKGQIIATIEDYQAVRDLVAPCISYGISLRITPELRETVDAVERILDSGRNEATFAELERELDVDNSNVSRRVANAVKLSYLVNLEAKKGRPARIILDKPLPDEDTEILPTVERLAELIAQQGELSTEAQSHGKPTPTVAVESQQDTVSLDVTEEMLAEETHTEPDVANLTVVNVPGKTSRIAKDLKQSGKPLQRIGRRRTLPKAA
jgi:hypothetical protein